MNDTVVNTVATIDQEIFIIFGLKISLNWSQYY